jgi:polysaccharide biosynthesis transport protein
MDLLHYIKPLLRWWWLLVLSVVVAAVSSYLAVEKQPNTYQAHTTLMIGNFIQNPNPNSSEYYVAQQLASTYADMANRELIQSETQIALNLPYLPENFTRSIVNTSMIEITVNDTDPKLTQTVANELAKQLIKHSPSAIGPEEEQRQKFITGQLNSLQDQIKETQNELDKLRQSYGELTGARQIADAQSQITAVQQKLASLQANYASLLSNSNQGATNTLTIIETAGVPTVPIGPDRILIVALSSAIGLGIASLAAYGIEALDNTIKTIEELGSLVKAPVLGYVEEIPNGQPIFVLDEPRSPFSDAFRVIRTNLEFVGVKNSLRTLLISSPEPSDGKSTIALNLAASMAQASNHKVFLIDADLRKPSLHKALSIKNENGLSEVCLGSIDLTDAIIPMHGGALNFIPAGTPPPNPVDLLDSPRMAQSVQSLKSMGDLTIIDCPPVFFADTLVLTGIVDGIILVVSIGRTRKKSITHFLEQVQKTRTNLVGVVINRVPLSDNHYPSYYYYRNSTVGLKKILGPKKNHKKLEAPKKELKV